MLLYVMTLHFEDLLCQSEEEEGALSLHFRMTRSQEGVPLCFFV